MMVDAAWWCLIDGWWSWLNWSFTIVCRKFTITNNHNHQYVLTIVLLWSDNKWTYANHMESMEISPCLTIFTIAGWRIVMKPPWDQNHYERKAGNPMNQARQLSKAVHIDLRKLRFKSTGSILIWDYSQILPTISCGIGSAPHFDKNLLLTRLGNLRNPNRLPPQAENLLDDVCHLFLLLLPGRCQLSQ